MVFCTGCDGCGCVELGRWDSRPSSTQTSNRDQKSTTSTELFMTFATVSRQTSNIKSKEISALSLLTLLNPSSQIKNLAVDTP